jgi:hypothetical protein
LLWRGLPVAGGFDRFPLSPAVRIDATHPEVEDLSDRQIG